MVAWTLTPNISNKCLYSRSKNLLLCHPPRTQKLLVEWLITVGRLPILVTVSLWMWPQPPAVPWQWQHHMHSHCHWCPRISPRCCSPKSAGASALWIPKFALEPTLERRAGGDGGRAEQNSSRNISEMRPYRTPAPCWFQNPVPSRRLGRGGENNQVQGGKRGWVWNFTSRYHRFLRSGATLGLMGTMTVKMLLLLSDGDTQRRMRRKLIHKTLLSHRKTPNTALCDNMAGPWEYHAKWSKSVRIS